MKKVAVIGATGLIGYPVTKELIDAGFDVTIVARDVKKAQILFPKTKVIYGDLNDKESLIKSLHDQEIVYVSVNLAQSAKKTDFMPETTGLLNLVSVAKSCKIQRIAYLSSLVKDYQGENCFNWWVFDVKIKAVQILKGSGIAYTVFYPSSFMENLDKGGFKSGNYMNLAGKSTIKQYWISGADYGKQVAKSFDLLTDENREYKIQGATGFSGEEAVKIFINNYRVKNLKIRRTPLFLLKIIGMLSSKVNYIYHILYAINHYKEKFDAQLTWDELGKPKESIEKYTQRVQQEIS